MLKNFHKKISFFVNDRPLPKATNRDQELTEKLLKSVERLPSEDTSTCAPSEKEWNENVNRLKQLILSDNPRKFLRWDILTKTMVVGNDDFVLSELNHLKRNSNWNKRWSKAIKEVAVGYPKPFYKHPDSSATLIHHAYHISQFEKRTGVQIETTDFVFEFGAGYGSMCRLFYNLGFKGTYIMFDMPIFCELQKYFLRCIGIPVYTTTNPRLERIAVSISGLEKLRELLSNNASARNAIFIATWSISEVPLKLREEIFSLVSDFSFFLMGYQNQFGKIDNIKYFDSITKDSTKSIQWHNFPIKHLPGNHYLIGARR